MERLTAALSASDPSLRAQLPAAESLIDGQERLDAIVARCGHRRCTATCSHRPTPNGWCPAEWSSLLELEGPARDAAGSFLVHQTAASLPSYARDLDDFVSWCSARGLELLEVRRGHVDLWQRGLEAKGRRPATIARQLSAVAGFFHLAVVDDWVARNAVDGVRRPTVGGDSPQLGLTRDQARAFLDEAAAASSRDHALACLLVLNGLRVSEAVRVRSTDCGEARGHRVVRVRRKGGAMVDVALAPRTAAALEELFAGVTESAAPLFVDRDGQPLDRFDATRIVRRLARHAGIHHVVSPHSLRHTFVTAALDAGVSLRDVQDAAGHADPRTTRRYDRGRHSLDRHATYAVAQWLA